MSNRRLRFGLLLFVVSCTDSGWDVISDPEVRGPWAHTDSTQYLMTAVAGGISESIRVTYTNLLPQPVYFARCTRSDAGPMYSVVRAGPDSLTPLELGQVWACVGGVPIGTLLPGEKSSFDVGLATFDDPNHPIPLAQRTGSMKVRIRLCLRYRSDSDNCELDDLTPRETNTFTLIPPVPSPGDH